MSRVTGTIPPGTSSEQQAAQWVERMFAQIAPKYDLLNHLLSLNIDRKWRRALIARLAPALTNPESRVLDLCCGTGDVLIDMGTSGVSQLMGADFCHPMLITARRKAAQRGLRAVLFEADAMKLPLADNSLDAISIAFGFRNLVNYQAALTELHRALKPRGILAILEFSHPAGALTKLTYRFYSSFLLPLIGGLISGSREAYTYLPDSIRKFPTAEQLRVMMDEAGFTRSRFDLLSGGIAAVHAAEKSACSGAGNGAIDFVAQT